MSEENSDLKAVSDERGFVSVVVELKKSRSFAASEDMESTKNLVPGVELDMDFGAVPISPSPSEAAMLDMNTEDTVVVKGRIAKKNIPDLRKQSSVLKVWLDTDGIRPANRSVSDKHSIRVVAATGTCPIPPCDCSPDIPKGSIADVVNYLGVTSIWSNGYKGEGIVVAVQDGGITAEGRQINSRDTSSSDPKWPGRLIKNVIGGSRADWGTTGVDWEWHGNMCATDVLGMAPEAKIYDLRIVGDTLSSAFKNFQWAINKHRQDGTPQIITNSWAYYQKAWDPDYTTDPDHFLTRIIIDAINEGILVLFCAGNCGNLCADWRCLNDTGPGRSIWGANGHEKVITVAGVNKDEQYIGYSSVGPASLNDKKPDFASISHFTGFFQSDNGTSAATPIAAGVVALLKQAKPSLTQREVKDILMSTSKDIGPAGYDAYTGAGIIQAKAAYDSLAQG